MIPAFRISSIRVMNFTGQQKMTGHVVTSRLDVNTVVRELPLSSDQVELHALVTTAYTSAQRITDSKIL